MNKSIHLADAADCPPGGSLELVVGERVIALFNVDGEFYALDGVCPHQGGPLGKGCMDGGVVTCPWHGWQFDVQDGKCLLSAEIRQPTIPLRFENDQIFLDE